jgi:hypothetical protein
MLKTDDFLAEVVVVMFEVFDAIRLSLQQILNVCVFSETTDGKTSSLNIYTVFPSRQYWFYIWEGFRRPYPHVSPADPQCMCLF